MVKSFVRFPLKKARKASRMKKFRVPCTKRLKECKKWERVSSLEKLPLDIMYEIIRYSQESMNCLRLTCSTLNDCVQKFKQVRSLLPAMQTINFTHCLQCRNVKLRIALHPDTVSCFDFPRMSGQNERNIIEYRIPEWNGASLASIKRTLSLRFDCLHMFAGENLVEDYIMYSWVEGVAINLVQVCILGNFDSDRFLQFIKRSRVERLEIVINDCPISNPEDFLLKIAEICSSIHIEQHHESTLSGEIERHLLGKSNFDWTDTFAAMFERKMNYLKVTNKAYPSYFTEANCDAMKKALQRIGNKKVRFDTRVNFPLQTSRFMLETLGNDYYLIHNSNEFIIAHKGRSDFEQLLRHKDCTLVVNAT